MHLSVAGAVSVPKRACHHQQQLLLFQGACLVLVHADNLHGTQETSVLRSQEALCTHPRLLPPKCVPWC